MGNFLAMAGIFALFYNFQFQEATDWLEVGLSLPEPTNLILCKKQQVNLRATGRPILSFEPD